MGRSLTLGLERALVAAAIIVIAAATANAQQPDPREVQPERPTVATHAGTVAPGYLEIEAGVEHDRFAPNSSSGMLTAVFKFGIAPGAQLSVMTTAFNWGASFGDLGVGVKWRLLDDAPILGDFAILPSITLPTSSGPGSVGEGLLLISSHVFGSVSMDLNAGVMHRNEDIEGIPQNGAVWTFSFGGPVRGPIGWTAEYYGYPALDGSRTISAVLAGPTAKIRKYLAVDAGIIVPVTGPQPHAIYAGAVYNVGKVW